MKNPLLAVLIPAVVILSLLSSCSKDSSEDNSPAPPATSLDGTWETTNWFDPNDIVRVTITSSATTGTGRFSYLNAKAALTGFFVGDKEYENITKSGTDTYNATFYYRYGPANAQLGHTSGVLAVQSNGTVLYAHAPTDPLTGIAPKDHYFQKK